VKLRLNQAATAGWNEAIGFMSRGRWVDDNMSRRRQRPTLAEVALPLFSLLFTANYQRGGGV
jgi:hypothetical protein